MGGNKNVFLLVLVLCVAHTGAEICDVLGAVACFEDLGGAPTADQIVTLPQEEIVKPCQAQAVKGKRMSECVHGELTGDCEESDLSKEVQSFISYHTMYCTEVDACENFPNLYHHVLTCADGLRTKLVEAAKVNDTAKAGVCSGFKQCLTSASTSCIALSMLATQEWAGYETTCMAVNVTMQQQDAVDASETYCSNIQSKSMNLHECHLEFMEANAAATGMSDKCKAMEEFNTCAATATFRCHTLTNAVDEVREQLEVITQPFCAAEGKCNYEGIAGCYANFADSLWKVSEVISGETDMEVIMGKVQQSTGLFRDIDALCRDIDAKEAETLACLQEELGGCAPEFDTDFMMKADFVKQLCEEFKACPAEPALNDAVGTCFSEADVKLKALNLTHYKEDFCKTFEDMAVCVQGALWPCPGDVMYVAGAWLQLARDLSPVCPDVKLQLTNYTMEDIIMNLIGCGDLVERGVELAQCEMQYFHAITEDLSNRLGWCSAFTEYKTCLLDVSAECTVLEEHIGELIEATEEGIGATCEGVDAGGEGGAGEGGEGGSGGEKGDTSSVAIKTSASAVITCIWITVISLIWI